MKYFTIKELCKSTTAKQKGIDNTPSVAVTDNLIRLVENLLDPIREEYGKPITVTSGYRCSALNKAVGGKSTSRHLKGCAADLWCKDLNTIHQIALKMDFDECILEHVGRSKWLHVAYVSPEKNRHKALKIKDDLVINQK